MEGASRTAMGRAYWRAAHLLDDSAPWILGDRLGRGEVEEMLRASGFRRVELLGATELAARYCAGRPERRLHSSTLIAVAAT